MDIPLDPEDLGRLGSDLVEQMMRAAEAYCIERAVAAVRSGFKQGYGQPCDNSIPTTTPIMDHSQEGGNALY